jgi:hypothetical protein
MKRILRRAVALALTLGTAALRTDCETSHRPASVFSQKIPTAASIRLVRDCGAGLREDVRRFKSAP